MRKLIRILFVLFVFSACNETENSLTDINSYLITNYLPGSWFSETQKNYEEDIFIYTETGKGLVYTNMFFNKIRVPERRNGSYTIDQNTITQWITDSKGDNFGYTHVIEDISPLHINLSSKNAGTCSLWRIIGVESIQIGEKKDLDPLRLLSNFTDEQVRILGFSVVDESIASVNNSGTITAKLQGITYVRVETTCGIVIIKINVNDDENLWNDYTLAFRKNIDEVEDIFGSCYSIKNESMIGYLSNNTYIDTYILGAGDRNKINHIDLFLRPEIEKTQILNYLEGKYKIPPKESTMNNMLYFYFIIRNDKNFIFNDYIIEYHPKECWITYELWDSNRSDYSWLLGESYNTVFDYLGRPSYYDKGKSIEYIYDDDFIYSLYFNLENNNVKNYYIFLNENVSHESVYEYLKYSFIEFNGINSYISNRMVNSNECLIICNYYPESHELQYQIKIMP